MKRAVWLLALALAACGHARSNGGDSIAVAPKPVVAKPLEVIGEAASGASDVGSFELALGNNAFCVRLEGKVWCGRGASDAPIVNGPPIGGIEDAISISTRGETACLVRRGGTVHCWGNNAQGQLGAHLQEETSAEPVAVVGVTNARRVVVGDDHSCAITHAGSLWCWGANGAGETGGSTSWAPAARDLVTATEVPGLHDVVAVAMSYHSTCALDAKHAVWCWGASITPEQQKARDHQNEQPFRIATLAKSEDLSADGGAFCTARGGDAYCIGSTYSLVRRADGTDYMDDRDNAGKIALGSATKVRVGGAHACALARDGRVICFGYGASGELGRADVFDSDHAYEPKDPAPVESLPIARDIVVGRSTSCAITGPEEAWCWGLWPYDPRGTGQPKVERTPVRLRIR